MIKLVKWYGVLCLSPVLAVLTQCGVGGTPYPGPKPSIDPIAGADDSTENTFSGLGNFVDPNFAGPVFAGGVIGQYYSGLFLGSPETRKDPFIAFWAGGGYGKFTDWGLPSTIDKKAFSVRWTGYVRPKDANPFQFCEQSSGQFRIWVDSVAPTDTPYLDESLRHGPSSFADTCGSPLANDETRKLHKIVVEFAEHGNGSEDAAGAAILKWTNGGLPIESKYLYSEY